RGARGRAAVAGGAAPAPRARRARDPRAPCRELHGASPGDARRRALPNFVPRPVHDERLRTRRGLDRPPAGRPDAGRARGARASPRAHFARRASAPPRRATAHPARAALSPRLVQELRASQNPRVSSPAPVPRPRPTWRKRLLVALVSLVATL